MRGVDHDARCEERKQLGAQRDAAHGRERGGIRLGPGDGQALEDHGGRREEVQVDAFDPHLPAERRLRLCGCERGDPLGGDHQRRSRHRREDGQREYQ